MLSEKRNYIFLLVLLFAIAFGFEKCGPKEGANDAAATSSGKSKLNAVPIPDNVRAMLERGGIRNCFTVRENVGQNRQYTYISPQYTLVIGPYPFADGCATLSQQEIDDLLALLLTLTDADLAKPVASPRGESVAPSAAVRADRTAASPVALNNR